MKDGYDKYFGWNFLNLLDRKTTIEFRRPPGVRDVAESHYHHSCYHFPLLSALLLLDYHCCYRPPLLTALLSPEHHSCYRPLLLTVVLTAAISNGTRWGIDDCNLDESVVLLYDRT
jgi:hypothetical protein